MADVSLKIAAITCHYWRFKKNDIRFGNIFYIC